MIAAWVRERLWRADNWVSELAALRQHRNRSPEQVFELAVATEHCDPDRGNALALYLDATRSGYAPARDRARGLAMALGAHTTLAELSLGTGDLVGAGTAYLDAGFPELAIEPLQKVVDARPPGASVATEHLRLERVTPLLAIAKRMKIDIEREIAGCMSAGNVPSFLAAERLARLSGLDDKRAQVINAARIAFPEDPYVSAIVAARLFERNNPDDLLAYYSDQFERAPSRAHYVARVCGAGVELIARNVQPGLGLRLLRMGLEAAYAASLPVISSHLAAWQLIWMHAKQQFSTAELAPLIVQAFNAPLPEDDAVFLARLGLEIAWKDVNDPLAAQPYAAVVLDFVPDHPLAVAFVEEVMPPELIEPPPELVTSEIPVVVTFGTPKPPAPPPPAPLPEPPEQLAKATSRIPVLDQGQVKRSGPASSPAHKTTSRVDLLRAPARTVRPATVPPPRAAHLRRDTSPIPMARRPATAPPPVSRAERKVVPVDVVVELPTGAFFSTVLRDVSTSGAFVVTKRAMDTGKIVSMELKVPDPGKLTQTTYRVNARVARRTDLGWGVAFIDASRELVAALKAATA